MQNVFRKQYRVLTPAEQALVDGVKDKAQELYDLFDESTLASNDVTPDPRALAVFKTNLEQAVMWGVKSVTG